MSATQQKSGGSEQAVGRALDIMLCFSTEEPELGTTELAQRLGLHKSTVHRIASFLASRGFLIQDGSTAKYRLGLKLVELGSLALRQMDVRRAARPYIRELARRTEESVFLALRDGDVAVYIDIAESPRPISITAYIGRRAPLHCTGTGKVLLANLPESEIDHIIECTGLHRYTANTLTDPYALKQHLATIRTQGYAIDNEENQEGIVGVAAPVLDGAGRVIAAISLAGPSVRLRPRLLEIIAEVKETARTISLALGHRTETSASVSTIV